MATSFRDWPWFLQALFYVGLAVSSGNTSSLATATFDNVSVTMP